MRVTFSLEFPVNKPQSRAMFKAENTGYIYGRIRITECSKKKHENTVKWFAGNLPFYAPYFKYTGFVKFNQDQTVLLLISDRSLDCQKLDEEYLRTSWLNFFLKELDFGEHKEFKTHIKKLGNQKQVLLKTFLEQDFATEDFKNQLDYFRYEKEKPIADLFSSRPTQVVGILFKLRKKSMKEILRITRFMETRPWLLCFERWSTDMFGLPRVTYTKFVNHIKENKIAVPQLEYTAVREYENIHKVRKKHGHTLFSSNVFTVTSPTVREELRKYLEFKAITTVKDCHLEDEPFAVNQDYNDAESIVEWFGDLSGRHNPLKRLDYGRPCIPLKSFTEEQRRFLTHLMDPDTSVAILQGGPGTGKSYTGLEALLFEFARPLIVTYTGMMVDAGRKRMGPPHGRPEVMNTIHYVICISEFVKDAHKWLRIFDVVVFDESSNVDLHLLARLLRCVPNAAKIVLLGDLGQIYPISPGCPFADLIQYYDTSSFLLTENKRVEANARVLADASRHIMEGSTDMIDWSTSALTLLDNTSMKDGVVQFLEQYCNSAKQMMNIQFVTMRNADRKAINEIVRDWLITRGYLSRQRNVNIGVRKRLLWNEKITFTKNSKEVCNGELALAQSCKIDKETHRRVFNILGPGNIEKAVTLGDEYTLPSTIQSGYASTCNKAQGSEWDYVLFYMHEDCGDQEWWSQSYPYVAISRAKVHCTVVTPNNGPIDLHMMSQRKQPPRHTILSYLLQNSALNKDEMLDPMKPLYEPKTENTSLLHPDILAIPTLASILVNKKQKTENFLF